MKIKCPNCKTNILLSVKIAEQGETCCKDCKRKSNKIYCHSGLSMLNKKHCKYYEK